MSSEARILVVKPGSMESSDKALLKKSNIIVVESVDPSSVRLLSAEASPLTANELFYAAMEAVVSDETNNGGATRKAFAMNMAAMTRAARGIPRSEKP
jgi:hypothetical protein